MTPIFHYLDYRRYLVDRLSDLQRKNPRFSYRAFNRLAGLRSSATLKLVVDGKRNLSEDAIEGIRRGFKMTDEEFRYFRTLVRFNQATNHDERGGYFQALCQQRGFLASKPLTAAQFRLFSHWYYVAIVELVRMETHAVKDAAWIQRHIRPEVGLKEVREAVKDLKALDLLYEDDRGSLQRHEALLRSEDEVEGLFATNFHCQMSEMAREAVISQEPEEREFSTLTVLASEEALRRAKQEIQKFRKRLHSMIEMHSDQHPSNKAVAQINLQLFKLSGNVGNA